MLCAFLVNRDEYMIKYILTALECVLKAGVGQMVDGAIEGVGGTSGLIPFCTSVDFGDVFNAMQFQTLLL